MQPSSNNQKTKIILGERIGQQGRLRLGCSGVLFDDTGDKVLLTRRRDNGEWCLPGGMIDPGETVAEGCEREFLEETNLRVRIVRLTGVYSNPDKLIIYPDGNKAQIVVLNFEVLKVGGTLALSDETIDARFFPAVDAIQMELFHGHAEHIHDALAHQSRPFLR
jgi:8-oxo-dGTP pyrophosphatase MutT (NUDIX family)